MRVILNQIDAPQSVLQQFDIGGNCKAQKLQLSAQTLTKAASMTSLGSRIRQLRKDKNLSQQAIEKITGINYVQFGRYERDEVTPNSPALQKIADALGTTIDFLLDGSTDDIAEDRLSDKELLRQFQEVEKFPEQDKHIIKRLISSFIADKKLQDIVAR